MSRKSSCARILSMFGWRAMMVASETVIYSWDTIFKYIQDPVDTSSLAVGLDLQELDIYYLDNKKMSVEILRSMREKAFKTIFLPLFNLLKEQFEKEGIEYANRFYSEIDVINKMLLNYLLEPFRTSQFNPEPLGNVEELINSLTSTVTLFDKTCITEVTHQYKMQFSSSVNDMLEKISTFELRELYDALSSRPPPQNLEAHYKNFLEDLHNKTMVTAGYGAGGVVSGVLSYCYHPVFIAGTAIVLTAGAFYWRDRRNKAQQQQIREQALTKFSMDLQEQLPKFTEKWHIKRSFDHTGATIVYSLNLENYLSCEMNSQTWSITRGVFEEHFSKVFADVFKPTASYQASVEFISEHNENQVRLTWSKIPGIPDVELTNELKGKIKIATDSFLEAIKEFAAETKITKYAARAQKHFAESKSDDAYLGGLVESWLSQSGGRQKMVAFVRDQVLGGNLSDITGIVPKFEALTEVNFTRLSLNEKLTALTWLHHQLCTIARLVCNSDQLIPISDDTTYARFYYHFANAINDKAGKGSERAKEFQAMASRFLEDTLEIASQITSSGAPTRIFTPLKIRTRLTAVVDAENQRNNAFRAKWEQKFSTIAMTPEQKHKQAKTMKRFIQNESPLKILPLDIVSLFRVLTNEPAWISSPLLNKLPKRHPQSLIAIQRSSEEIAVRVQESNRKAAGKMLSQADDLRQSQKTPLQINLGLLYCLSRIILFSLQEFPKARSLEGIRMYLGHFSYKLELSISKTSDELYNLAVSLVQTFEKAKDTIEENPFSTIEDNPLYQRLERIEATLTPGNDLQKIEATVIDLWDIIRHRSGDEGLTMRGWMIVCGQAGRDLSVSKQQSKLDAKVISFLRSHCSALRNLAMHEPGITIPIQRINDALGEVAQLDSPLKTSQAARPQKK